MTVDKIMRRDVVALNASESIDAAWQQMRGQELAALAVTDRTGHLVGVLAEQDLLARLAPRRARRWWTGLFDDKDRLAADYVKAVGVTVGELMTGAPVTVTPDTSIEEAATLMSRHAIGVLPVVAEDHVYLGLVTRAIILDHLAWPTPASPGTVSDAEIESLMQEGIQQELWASRHLITVDVDHGTIRLTGVAKSPAEKSALLAMARSAHGCVGVEDRLLVLRSPGRRLPAPVI